MLLTVGRITRPHGIRGEVIVDIRTDEPEKRFQEGSVFHTGSSSLTLATFRWHQGRLIAVFDEIPDRNTAEAMRGTELKVDSATLESPSDPDEFLDFELEGLTVSTMDGTVIGTLLRVDHGPAHDMLVVKRPSGPNVLVPFISHMVPTVDVAGGRIVIDPPEGLLDL